MFKISVKLSELAISVLGKEAAERIKLFETFEDGWGGGKGRTLCWKSLETLEVFVQHCKDCIGKDSNLFMGLDGHLELQWRSDDHMIVEIGCHPGKIEYYIETHGYDSWMFVHKWDEDVKDKMKDLRDMITGEMT